MAAAAITLHDSSPADNVIHVASPDGYALRFDTDPNKNIRHHSVRRGGQCRRLPSGHPRCALGGQTAAGRAGPGGGPLRRALPSTV